MSPVIPPPEDRHAPVAAAVATDTPAVPRSTSPCEAGSARPPAAGPGRPGIPHHAGTPQLPLALTGDPARLACFEPGPNAAALAAVTRLARERCGCVTLWGPAGSGKSHLLAGAVAEVRSALRMATGPDTAVRARVDETRMDAPRGGEASALLHLQGAAIRSLPDCIAGEDLASFTLIALDTRTEDWGDPRIEEAVFRACHRARAGELGLLLALSAHPEQSGIRLADLRSRLLGGDCFRLAPADEATRRRILCARAGALGLALGEDALDYLLARLPRDLHNLCDFIDRLDRASLAEQRRPTVPFLRDLIEWSAPGARLPPSPPAPIRGPGEDT